MDEAKAIINIKEGIIELQGPVDFVRYYLDKYQSAIKELQGLPKNVEAVQEKVEALPEKKAKASIVRAKKARHGACIGSIRGYIEAGFFNELRSLKEVRKHLDEGEVICTERAVRAGLTRLAKSGALSTTGKGRALRFSHPKQKEIK